MFSFSRDLKKLESYSFGADAVKFIAAGRIQRFLAAGLVMVAFIFLPIFSYTAEINELHFSDHEKKVEFYRSLSEEELISGKITRSFSLFDEFNMLGEEYLKKEAKRNNDWKVYIETFSNANVPKEIAKLERILLIGALLVGVLNFLIESISAITQYSNIIKKTKLTKSIGYDPDFIQKELRLYLSMHTVALMIEKAKPVPKAVTFSTMIKRGSGISGQIIIPWLFVAILNYLSTAGNYGLMSNWSGMSGYFFLYLLVVAFQITLIVIQNKKFMKLENCIVKLK